jgi:hypothetical protein
MGTRSIINIQEDGKILLTIYRQYDGYPAGLGKDIQNALGHTERCSEGSGYGGHEKLPQAFSGIGCAAAYLVSQLKDSIGNVYIMLPGTNDVGEEYTYTIYIEKNQLCMSIKGGRKTLYKGTIKDFKPEDKGE